MSKTAYCIAVDPDTNKVVSSGLLESFSLNYSANSVETSDIVLRSNQCKNGDLIAIIPLSGFGNFKADTRAPSLNGSLGPCIYYGVVTAVGDDTEHESDSQKDSLTVANMKYYMDSTYAVEPGSITDDTGLENGPLAFLTYVLNKWLVLTPLGINRSPTKKYTGEIKSPRYPQPDSSGTENLIDLVANWFNDYGIVFSIYGDMMRSPLAPRSSNDNLLPTNENVAGKTVNGIKWLSTGQGSYRVSGTCDAAESLYTIYNKTPSQAGLSIGGAYQVRMNATYEGNTNVTLNIWALNNGSWTLLCNLPTNQNGSITIPAGTTRIWARLRVDKGKTVYGTDEGKDSFVVVSPYIVINGNTIPMYSTTTDNGTNTASSSINNGITYMQNGDGSYIISGTCTGEESLCSLYHADITETDYIKGKTYTCGLFPKVKGVSINIWYWDGAKWAILADVTGEGDPTSSTVYTRGTFTIPNDAKRIWIRLRVSQGLTVQQQDFRPYVCMSSGSPYQLVFGSFISGDDIGLVSIDRSAYIKDASVFVRPFMNGQPNGINIATTNQDDDNTYASVTVDKRYITKTGVIVSTPDHEDIVRPIKMTTYIYTPEVESETKDGVTTKTVKKKSADDIAREQLRIPLYSNEIKFNINVNHPRIDEICKLGNIMTVLLRGKQYKTIVSAFTISNESDWIQVTGGTVNTKLSAIIHEAQSSTTNSNTSSNNTVVSNNVTSQGSANIQYATTNDIDDILNYNFLGGK